VTCGDVRGAALAHVDVRCLFGAVASNVDRGPCSARTFQIIFFHSSVAPRRSVRHSISRDLHVHVHVHVQQYMHEYRGGRWGNAENYQKETLLAPRAPRRSEMEFGERRSADRLSNRAARGRSPSRTEYIYSSQY
jgi:hypothetical protein